ncbi:MAG: transglycosylase SLT domain-containing protein [Cyanobacteriota bacterium]|nr:transglycosylase SLT domain-containing protein [Cyanobacteriota bacterium]
MVRLPALLAISCLGPGLLIAGGRAGLESLRPPLTPDTSTTTLARIHRWSPEPWRRREAALLLDNRAAAAGDGAARAQLLQAQGWGRDLLAPVVLRRAALTATALGGKQRARELWQQLLQRFPNDPISADALYQLGRQRPELRAKLLQRWPAHPAALAAALEVDAGSTDQHLGALHLARWGPRWPGAEPKLRASCRAGAPLSPNERGQLAAALAELGDGAAALTCQGSSGRLSPAGELTVARALLRGAAPQPSQGQARLVTLATRRPPSAEADEALRLLSQQPGEEVLALLQRLPADGRSSAPVQARLALALAESDGGTDRPALAVLKRFPTDPASWDLQWDVARRRLLDGQWTAALNLLKAIPPETLPPPLAARLRFWIGYSQMRLGDQRAATASWQALQRQHPSGYYGWRSAARLGQADLKLNTTSKTHLRQQGWEPLASGDGRLDQLWRLGLTEEAWELWRSQRRGQPTRGSEELLVEGRLRQGVGDDWTGLGQLELASLRLDPRQCQRHALLERQLHPTRYGETFRPVEQAEGLPPGLLAAVGRQESRFSAGVRSGAGAVGLLQLMPDTAAELAGRPLDSAALEDPQLNARLGGRYLRQLLDQWRGQPLLAVASYNAGPGAVQEWVNPRLTAEPELWVEAIPYPETRLYVKKVLGNLWTYQNPGLQPQCG